MAKRSKGWDKNMLEDLNDPSFSRELMIAAVESGVPMKHALGDIIRGIGVKEFAASIRMPGPHVVRAVHPAHNTTERTLERLLEPFGLRLGLAPNGRSQRPRRLSGRRRFR